jgi:hypothetical protein
MTDPNYIPIHNSQFSIHNSAECFLCGDNHNLEPIMRWKSVKSVDEDAPKGPGKIKLVADFICYKCKCRHKVRSAGA